MFFDQGDYEGCRKLCDQILRIAPQYSVAEEIRFDAVKAALRPEYAEYVRKKIENWRTYTSEDGATIPYVTTCEIRLEPTTWVTVCRSRITLSGTDLDLDQWLAVLAAAGVSIRLEGRPDHDGRITLHTGEIPVEEALDLIAVLFGLTWRRNEDFGIILESCP